MSLMGLLKILKRRYLVYEDLSSFRISGQNWKRKGGMGSSVIINKPWWYEVLRRTAILFVLITPALNGVIFCDKVLKGPVLSYESFWQNKRLILLFRWWWLLVLKSNLIFWTNSGSKNWSFLKKREIFEEIQILKMHDCNFNNVNFV